MNKIRRSWLGRGSVMALVAAGLIGLGACSGSDDGLSQALEEALQERLDQALEDLDDLEDERDEALDERDDALEERDDARDDLQGEQQENQGLQEERGDLQEERDEARQKLDRFVAFEIVGEIPDTILRSKYRPLGAGDSVVRGAGAGAGACHRYRRNVHQHEHRIVRRVVHDDSIRKRRAKKRFRRNLLQRGNSDSRGHSRLFCPRSR